MRFLTFLISLGLSGSPMYSQGQELHKHFELGQNTGNEIVLQLKTNSGQSYLSSVSSAIPMEIYSKSEKDIAAGDFKTQLLNGKTHINAELTCKEHIGVSFTEAVASNLFTPEEELSDVWMVKLSKQHEFILDLNYLMGKAELDLSGLSLKRLKINSGSANVKVDYKKPIENALTMDSLFIKVNMGNITLHQVNLTKAKEIIAEVGFGKIFMQCAEDWTVKSNISATIGAGSMVIDLPDAEQPILIKIDSSPLCHIKLPDNFAKIGHNAYSNKFYQDNKNNAIVFNLNVGMGSISFE